MTETWVPVRGWENLYEVSDQGRVRSKDRLIVVCSPRGGLAPRKYKGRILAASVGSHGYKGVCFIAPGRSRETRTVHSLVAEHFLPDKPEGAHVLHNNGNKEDCAASNLRWGTPKENAEDAVRQGALNPARGERSGMARLTDDKVAWAREQKGMSYREMARHLGVAHGTVRNAVLGVSWSHL